ncbi:Fusaric acid resistance protein-like-domain-containing protein [Pseudomassariella vexata]|uniref:Fusaric acid resistance protein-like-domain-containing protein n=1 Tax=Pseudomassariella vexata TaxID=1141098 RepID=A0A1Y2DDD4_9PEZI|nr:Fusaric acid resistance protein-like-domain-containing protein [Pseudomassariella vexata]ORY57281.1 Fusaric acid resistance protein-like-domain-containing protein [Pseudomassariella vexata]
MTGRQKLRNGTWIIPGTGERSQRQFTLRAPNLDGPGDGDGMRSLLEQETMGEKLRVLTHNARVGAYDAWVWLKSEKGKGTLKCSVAYLFASLWTFYPPFARFLGPMDGKHIVATITVYFHPWRTTGSQIEAVAIAVVAVLYAMLVGTLSMLTSVVVGSSWHQVKLSYALILLIFIGGGLGFIGWVKQKLNNPLVSVGVSIASIGIITIVTKENSVHSGVFSNQKIVQSLKILLIATTITTIVNLLLWPVSARIALRNTMRKASVSLGDMLSTVARGFLSGAEDNLGCGGFAKSAAAYNVIMTTMNKNLRESKYEYYFVGREEVYKNDKALVRSMERLAQSLGGLRSAANTKFELLEEKTNGGTFSGNMSPTKINSPTLGRSTSGPLKSGSKIDLLSSIDEAPDERSDVEDDPLPTLFREAPPSLASGGLPPDALRTPSEIFELFITRLGPSMKSLVHTLSQILQDPPFGAPGSPITVNEQYKQSVEEALSLFNSARAKALEELYRIIELDRSRPENVQADYEEVAAACGHFSFTLLSLGDEMQRYLDSLDDLEYATEQNRRSWNFLKFWNYIQLRNKQAIQDPEQDPFIKPVKSLRRSALPKGIPDDMMKRRDSFSWDAAPQASQFLRNTSQRLLKLGRFLATDDIRFGLKVGIGAILYAMFAFIPQTRPIYQHWRGEWGLLSFMIVCSMTVGAANTTGFSRWFGTLVGAAFVLLNWWISGGDAIPLAILGWLVSFGSFYLMVDRGNAPLCRFILLSYNVSSLYAYSLSQQVEDDDDDEGGIHPIIKTIAWHRVVAVSMGILWGLIICRVIWPLSARRKFKEGLCVLYLQMGLIWKRGPLAILLRNDSTGTYMKVGEQEAMQRYANQLQTLRSAATSEYELRGPFPAEAYGRIQASTQRLLDAFHAMSLVTQKHGRLSTGEKALLYHTAEERSQLCARTCHVFQVLASSIMLEYPLTDAIPSVEGTRDKLLGKIFRFRKGYDDGGEESTGEPNGNGNGKSAMMGTVTKVPNLGTVTIEETDYALLYAYALVTGQVAKELKNVEKEIEGLFGRLDEDALLLQ